MDATGYLKTQVTLRSTSGLGEIMSFKGDNINGETLGGNGFFGCERSEHVTEQRVLATFFAEIEGSSWWVGSGFFRNCFCILPSTRTSRTLVVYL